MEGKNGLKIVCDSGAGFSTEQAVFLANNLATKEYRISPINYVIQRRMTEAKWSLTNTELSQAEISWRVGYENVDHFAKLFLRHVGCSPSDYRRQFKNCFAEQEILSEFPQPVSLAG